MKSRLLLAVVVVLVTTAAPVQASGGSSMTPTPPRIAASSWYLVGGDGVVLAQHEPRRRRAPASITKLMTAIVTLEHARLSDEVVVSPRAARIGESTVYLRAGEHLTVGQLLRAMLVRSANDAAEALALYVGRGSQDRFVAMMNAQARELGLTDTTYFNPHGLDQAGHLSSARDTTLLVRYALGIEFIRESLQRTEVFLPGGRDFPTTDDVLESWRPLVAGKTGHTAEAGWSEAAEAASGGATVYGSVLGSRTRSDRNEALEELLSWGLARYRRVVAIDVSRTYAEAKTGYGRGPVVLVAPRERAVTVREGVPLVERVVSPVSVRLPVRRGQPLGRIEVYEGRHLVAAERLVAGRAVTEPGVLGKAAWYARRTAANLWGIVT